MRRLSTAAKILVSAAILLVLFRKVNLQHALAFAGNINYSFILVSIALSISAQLLRAYRLAVMLFGAPSMQEFRQVLRVQMVSFLPGVVSPAKLGEATKIYMLQTEMQTPLSRATSCFIAERVFDMLLLTPLAAIGLYMLLGPAPSISIRSGGLLMLVFVAAGMAVGVPVGLSLARRRGLSPAAIWQAAAPSRLVESGAITVFYWGFVFLEVWCFCRAALFAPSPWRMALVVPPALLSSLLPITFSGFGVREAALVFMLQRPQIQASYSQAILVSLMYIIFGIGVAALMGVFYLFSGTKQHVSQD